MPYLKRINSLPLINHISYKYTQVSDIGPSWSSCFQLLPFVNFQFELCQDDNFETIKPINLKLHMLIEHITGNCSAHKSLFFGSMPRVNFQFEFLSGP